MISRYPEDFDGNDNLYLVDDGLKVPLAFDYHPGNTSVLVEGDISKFPASGIITLVDQCSTPKERAVSLFYHSRSNREFSDLELLPDSIDCFKPKKITLVTMQVRADHREALKGAIFAIQNHLGTKHAEDEKTIFGRINALRKVLYAPKAWFEIDGGNGVAPLTTKFTFNGTGNAGPVGEVSYIWQLGDEERKTTEPVVEKIFLNPGSYSISLTIKNGYGEDSVSFKDAIKVKTQAPEQAKIKFTPANNQLFIDGPVPKIRTPINQPITVEVPQKVEGKHTFAGELVDTSNKAIDSVNNYTWNLADDLPHSNTAKTKAIYSVGGKYDLTLRTDTNLGAYRITNYENCIDVVDPVNLWLWTYDAGHIQSYEFGLVGEVLKKSSNTCSVSINDKFISDPREKFEFWRNNGAAKKSGDSGSGGDCLIYWASGRNEGDPTTSEKINFVEYNGFADIYKPGKTIQRPWNWAALASARDIHFLFGTTNEQYPTVSLTNKAKTRYNIETGMEFNETFEQRNFKNGGHELLSNPGSSHYSAYRTAWKENTGYILRNSGVGEYFAFQNFYKTEGTLGTPFKNIIKLPDMPGDHNKEGSLVALSNGIYFFNNYGNTYCFNDSMGIWELVNSHNKVARSELDGLLAASDGVSTALINIENTSFFKFNEIDMSYITFSHGPIAKQWLMTIF